MKTQKIALIATSALAAVLFLGWVVPDYAYTRRLSREKAGELVEEFKKLYFRNWATLKDSSLPKLTEEEMKRWNAIKLKLVQAGYQMEVDINESTGTINSSLANPKYAQ